MLNNFGGLPRSFSCLSCSIFLRNSSNPSSLFGSLRGFSSELLLHRNWQEMRWNSFNAQRHHPNTTQTMIIIVLLCSSILSFSKKKLHPNRFRNQNLCDIASSVTISEAFRFLGCSMAIRFRGVLRCCDLPLLWAAPIGIQLGDPYPRFPFKGAIGAMGIPIPMRPSCLPIGSFQAAPTPAPGGGAASA